MARRSPRTAIHFLAAATMVATACSPGEPETSPPPDTSVSVTDAAGRTVTLSQPARRVVSLVPSATATLHAIGASGVLVGRTDYDTQEWAESIASVGGGLEPSLEAIVALEPDLVLRFAGDQDASTQGRLEDLGIRYVTIDPASLDDILETAEILGALTGAEARTDSLVHELRQGLNEIATAVAGWPRIKFAYVLGGTPPWVSGPGTYIEEVLTLAGGDNAFADLGALYQSVSPEELRTREIDVVLVSSLDQFDPTLTPGARVVEIGGALELPGPAVVESARAVAELMHGRPLR